MIFGTLLLFAALVSMLGMMRVGSTVPGGTFYRPAFETLGDDTPIRIDPSSFKGSDWVDADGVLKPGAPLKKDGTLAGSAPGQTAERVVPYPVGIAEGNTDALLDAAPNGDVAARSRGDLMRGDIEAGLGRVLTADEVSAIEKSGRFVIL